MLTIRSDRSVPGLTGRQITDFLLEPTDERYQIWWPGTHLRFHVARPGRPDHPGDLVYTDEAVERRRIRHTAVVAEAVRGSRIVWRLGWRIPLPIRLTLDLTDTPDGVDIQHTITAGYTGVGRILDPLFRLYFTNRFAAAMNDHATSSSPDFTTYSPSRVQHDTRGPSNPRRRRKRGRRRRSWTGRGAGPGAVDLGRV